MTVSLTEDELGNQYVDAKGVIWEVTEIILGNYRLSNNHSYVSGYVYLLTSMSGLTKVHCLHDGTFAIRNSDGPFGTGYSPYAGKLVDRLISNQMLDFT